MNLRFGPDGEAEKPGPGSYKNPQSFAEQIGNSDSWYINHPLGTSV